MSDKEHRASLLSVLCSAWLRASRTGCHRARTSTATGLYFTVFVALSSQFRLFHVGQTRPALTYYYCDWLFLAPAMAAWCRPDQVSETMNRRAEGLGTVLVFFELVSVERRRREEEGLTGAQAGLHPVTPSSQAYSMLVLCSCYAVKRSSGRGDPFKVRPSRYTVSCCHQTSRTTAVYNEDSILMLFCNCISCIVVRILIFLF